MILKSRCSCPCQFPVWSGTGLGRVAVLCWLAGGGAGLVAPRGRALGPRVQLQSSGRDLGRSTAPGTPASTSPAHPHPGTSPAPACRGRRGDCQWGPASQPRMDTPQLNRLILRVTTSWVLSFLLRTNMLSAYTLHSPNTSQPQHFRVKSSVLLFQQESK